MAALYLPLEVRQPQNNAALVLAIRNSCQLQCSARVSAEFVLLYVSLRTAARPEPGASWPVQGP